MTIPSRPAPPPPQAASSAQRYTPTTNWNDTPFQGYQAQHPQNQQNNIKARKAPPPRPPPPKINNAPLKKPAQPQSINILSNLFGSSARRGVNSNPKVNSNSKTSVASTKLPPPPKHPAPVTQRQTNYGSITSTPSQTPTTDMQLISFDSPPSSPTFTQKSCSDCISVDSFSSDSNYSSPNNGNMSQAESGFEDDFISHPQSKESWDPFAMPPPKTAMPGSKVSVGGASFYAFNPAAPIRAPAAIKANDPDFIDPLCNGKSVVSKVQTKAMPTIIKPSISTKPTTQFPKLKTSAFLLQSNSNNNNSNTTNNTEYFDEDEDDCESLPSPPMPSCPPPPPPAEIDMSSLTLEDNFDEDASSGSYGIALYDFNGEQDDDLSFKSNDKIYLLKQLNDEWLFGKDKRGCEGMFPANFIDIKIPIGNGATPTKHLNTGDISHSNTSSSQAVRVLYNFNAETAEDLNLKEHDFVTVLYQITPEWLYGEVNNERGQFPSNFIEFIPSNLPQMPNH